jgi:hypothetical protein
MIKRNKDGSFSIEDNNSKFGTLVLIQNPKLSILNDAMLPLQVGRSFIQLSINKPWSLFKCCSNKTKSKKNTDYQVLNSAYVNIDNCYVIKDQNLVTETSILTDINVNNKNYDINSQNKIEEKNIGLNEVI